MTPRIYAGVRYESIFRLEMGSWSASDLYFPKPAHTEDILAAVKKVSAEARTHEGLVEIGAWLDRENDRIVNLSLWESQDHARNATKEMHPLFVDVPWKQWERKPGEDFLSLTRVV